MKIKAVDIRDKIIFNKLIKKLKYFLCSTEKAFGDDVELACFHCNKKIFSHDLRGMKITRGLKKKLICPECLLEESKGKKDKKLNYVG